LVTQEAGGRIKSRASATAIGRNRRLPRILPGFMALLPDLKSEVIDLTLVEALLVYRTKQ
jgi:DNA-binding transcriptional LysR family regulator